MFTTIIHPIRKALQLSCNEYCVLDTIHALSNNSDYGGWCYKSKQHIADDLDLSRRAIIDIINTLELKGYVIRNENGKFLKPSNDIRALFSEKQNWMIGVKSDDIKLLSMKFNSNCAETSPSAKCEESSQSTVQKLHTNCAETSHNIYNNKNNDINITPNPLKGEEVNDINIEHQFTLNDWIDAYKRVYEKAGKKMTDSDIDKPKVKKLFDRWVNNGRDPQKPLHALMGVLSDNWQRERNYPNAKLSSIFNTETVSRFAK